MTRILVLLFLSFQFTSFAQNRLTFRDIYDFNIGDEFHYTINPSPVYDGFRYKILDRKLSTTGDTIEYTIKKDNYTSVYNSSKMEVIYSFTFNTIIFTQANLDSFIDSHFDKSYNKDTCDNFRDSLYYSAKYKVGSYSYRHSKKIKCNFESEMIDEEFGVGLGLVYGWYGHPGFEPGHGITLVYYKKGNITNGNPDKAYAAVKSNISGKEVLKVYPNPVKSELRFLKDFNSDSRISITNSVGEYFFNNASFNNFLNVSELPQGIYYFSLQNNGEIYMGRFIKE